MDANGDRLVTQGEAKNALNRNAADGTVLDLSVRGSFNGTDKVVANPVAEVVLPHRGRTVQSRVLRVKTQRMMWVALCAPTQSGILTLSVNGQAVAAKDSTGAGSLVFDIPSEAVRPGEANDFALTLTDGGPVAIDAITVGGGFSIRMTGIDANNAGHLLDEDFKNFTGYLTSRDRVLTDLAYPFPFLKQTDRCWRLTDAETGNVIATDVASDTLWICRNDRKEDAVVTNGYGHVVAETWIWSPKDVTCGAWIDFLGVNGVYGRLWQRHMPMRGTWDNYGSSVWLNGERLAPSDWRNPGARSTAAVVGSLQKALVSTVGPRFCYNSHN